MKPPSHAADPLCSKFATYFAQPNRWNNYSSEWSRPDEDLERVRKALGSIDRMFIGRDALTWLIVHPMLDFCPNGGRHPFWPVPWDRKAFERDVGCIDRLLGVGHIVLAEGFKDEVLLVHGMADEPSADERYLLWGIIDEPEDGWEPAW